MREREERTVEEGEVGPVGLDETWMVKGRGDGAVDQ